MIIKFLLCIIEVSLIKEARYFNLNRYLLYHKFPFLFMDSFRHCLKLIQVIIQNKRKKHHFLYLFFNTFNNIIYNIFEIFLFSIFKPKF